MYFAPFLENTKLQPITQIISGTHYATKDSPWIALYNDAHIGFIPVAQWQLFTVDNITMHTPIQNPVDRFYILPGWENPESTSS